MLKDSSCGELNKEHIGTKVTLAGWVDRRRDHGGLTFIDLRDREGIVQVVLNPQALSDYEELTSEIRNEYVIQVNGEVSQRPAGTENPKLATGEIEVVAQTVTILNTSKTPPFYINEDIEIDESLRLKYRYLDLRRDRMQQIIKLRHRVVTFIRDFLNARGFIEIETPVLTKSTPEGARDYLVPSRVHPGNFYALPQSPQQLKQLLMVAGFEKYYQIARCFRDEDTRADRQPEHTQLDLEMSFVEEEDVLSLTEELITSMVETLKPEIRMIKPFPRITYDDSMARYGSDHLDLRFGMEIADLTDIATGTDFDVFRTVIAEGGRIKSICASGCAGYSRSQLDELNQLVQSLGAQGLLTIALGEAAGSLDDLTLDMIRSVATRFMALDQIKSMARRLNAQAGDLLLIVAGADQIASAVLGELRLEVAKRLGLTKPDFLAFAFITDFPLFTRDEKSGQLQATHHPFTAPKVKDVPLLDTAPEQAYSRHYDLVCNGIELSSGSIRIHNADVQRKVFHILGYNDNEIDGLFGHLLEAFDYGAPPHGGIAPGIDRIVMLLAGEETIRETIAFPKTQNATDLTFGAPSPVSKEQLDELYLSLMEVE